MSGDKAPRVTIGDLASSEPGAFKIGPFGSSLKKSDLVERGIPVLGIENVLPNHFEMGARRFISSTKFEELADYAIRPGDILVTTMGTIGRAAVVPKDRLTAIIDSHLFRMRVDAGRILPRYLAYALNSSDLAAQLAKKSRGAIMDGLNTTILKECELRLPPLRHQEFALLRLDAATQLLRKRRYAVQLCEGLLRAVFVEMFGDPEVPHAMVEDCLALGSDAIRTGPFGSQLLHSEFTETGVAVLGIDNAVMNRFEWDVRRFITREKYAQLKRYTVRPGDVLITLMGTCGRCAVVPPDIPLAINTKHLCAISPDCARCLPEFLHGAFLFDLGVQHQLLRATKGAIMDGLNMQIIRELRIPLPPLDRQYAFRDAATDIERVRRTAEEAVRQAEHFFLALLHQVFGEKM